VKCRAGEVPGFIEDLALSEVLPNDRKAFLS
jgi:hypothetical protein